jgi:ABC-type sugar transport system permease subunit
MRRKRALEGYLFILPWLIGVSAFFLYPLLKSIRLSFSKITKFAGWEMEWVGFDNYIRAFVWDINFLPMFFETAQKTLIYLPLINIFALFLAILLNKKIKARGLFRMVYFMPVILGSGYVMNQLVGGGVVQGAIDVERGVAIPREILMYMGPTVVHTVQNFMSNLALILWKSGVQIVLYISGLQGISSSLYEAARCDGASEWEMFWKITLPMTSPVILLSLIYTLIDLFADVSNPIVDYVRTTAFTNRQYEYGAAIGWIYFAFIFLIVVVVFTVGRRYVHDASAR